MITYEDIKKFYETSQQTGETLIIEYINKEYFLIEPDMKIYRTDKKSLIKVEGYEKNTINNEKTKMTSLISLRYVTSIHLIAGAKTRQEIIQNKVDEMILEAKRNMKYL